MEINLKQSQKNTLLLRKQMLKIHCMGRQHRRGQAEVDWQGLLDKTQ